jgi:RNase P subunit RPR2
MSRCIKEGRVKIRKSHTCFGCNEQIPTATVVYASVNESDGQLYTLYICEECKEIMKEYQDDLCDVDGEFEKGCVAEWKLEQ